MAQKPAKKRIRNPEQTREKLLQATVELIAEKGVEALSLKEAALKADVSRSATYLHFADREHLLEEAKLWIKKSLQDGITRFDDHTSLHDRVLFTTKLVLKYPEAAKIMVTDALSGGGLGLTDPLFKSVQQRIKQSKRKGDMDSQLDPEISAYIHLGSIASTLLLLEQHPKKDVDALAERFTKEWCRVLEHGIFNE